MAESLVEIGAMRTREEDVASGGANVAGRVSRTLASREATAQGTELTLFK